MKAELRSFGAVIAAAIALLLAASGSQGGTLHFNGASSYVSAGAQPGLKVTGTNLTLEAWIKPTGRGSHATDGGVVFGREGEYMIARYADGSLQYAFATPTHPFSFEDTGYPAPSNQWLHVALTYDGARVRFYVGGEFWSQYVASGPIGDIYPAEEEFRIGGRQHQGQYFQGQIDEVRLWNTNRSGAEISANMTRPLEGNEPGLLACYRFQEGSGTITADLTGRGRSGTLMNSPVWDCASEALHVPVPATAPATLVTETTARLNARVSPNGVVASNSFRLAATSSTALAFDGINDTVSLPAGPNYNAYPLTVTAWVKTAAPGVSGGIVNKYLSGSMNGWQLHLVNGQVRAWYIRDTGNSVFGGGDGLNGGNVDDGQWHHVAFSVGAAAGRLYVDGLLMATNGWTGTPGACTTTQPLRFGVYSAFFAGQLDDITLWNTELTPAAIAQLMTSSPTPAHPQFANLVGYWPLDEGTGTSASDAWGRDPAGLLAGGPFWVPQARPIQYLATPFTPLGGTNSVLDLDGVDDYVRVPAGRWFSNEFTIESWVFARSFNTWSRVTDFGNGASSDNVLFAFSSGTSGKPFFQVFPSQQSVSAPDPIPLNQWVHLTATLKSNVGTIYINGVAVGSNTMTAPSGTVIRNNNYIGRSNWAPPAGTDAYANALFDDVRIWKVARTPAQIRQFMAEAVSPADPDLLLNYRFDEPSGLTVVDSRSTAPQNGTLTNGASRLPFEPASANLAGLAPSTRYHFRSAATSTNGTGVGLPEGFATLTPAAGAALDFDAASDYVHTPNLRSYFANETVTLEVWFNARGPGVIVDERSVDMTTWADSHLEIIGTTDALQGEVRIRVWNTAAVSLGKAAFGTWNHAVLRYNKATLTLDGFLNGVKSATSVTPVDRQAPWESSAAYGLVYALGLADGLNLGSGAWFNGQMDEFRVWNVARTDADILRDFNRRLVLPLPPDHFDVLDFSSAQTGSFATLDLGEYVFTWVGFGDQQTVVNVGGANGKVLKDSIVNVFGAGVSISRKDGRPFFFESLDAAGIAAGADAIQVTFPAESGNPQVVQVITPTTTGFATYGSALPDRRVTQIWLNIVSVSTDMAVDNIRLRSDGLVAYYRMDEGAGSVLADATGRGNDALRLGTNSPAWVPSTAPIGWPLVTTSSVEDIVLGDVTLDATVKSDAASDTRTWIEYGQYVPVPNSAENFIYFYYGTPTVPAPVSLLSQVNFDAVPYGTYSFTTIDFNTLAGRYPPWGDVWYCAARYLGRVFLPVSGAYSLYLASDDGGQLLVDGQPVVTYDGLHGGGEVGASINLTAGYHRLETRMFNNTGDAVLRISYAGPGIPKQVIPAAAFLRQQAVFTGRTAPQTNAAANGFQDLSAMATNIGGSGTYVFRVAAANAYGTNYGPVQSALMGSPGAFTALFFNGLGAHVQVPDGADFLAFPGKDQFTLEAWINPSWIGATQTVVSKFNQPTNREYFLALNPQGRVVFHRQGSDYVSSAAVVAGQYTHLAVTYDGTDRRIYNNGQLDPAVDPGSGTITNWTAPFVIGARYWSNSLADFFPGIIDDVRVWQVARSQTQIASDMNRRLSGYELGLVAYYRFDEARGGVASDSTVYDSPGLLVNGPVYVPSGASFACSSAAPILSIAVLDFAPGVVVWWPITCNEYILEEADVPNAPPDAWYPVWEPVTPIGGTYAVVLLWDRWHNGFFRLRRL